MASSLLAQYITVKNILHRASSSLIGYTLRQDTPQRMAQRCLYDTPYSVIHNSHATIRSYIQTVGLQFVVKIKYAKAAERCLLQYQPANTMATTTGHDDTTTIRGHSHVTVTRRAVLREYVVLSNGQMSRQIALYDTRQRWRYSVTCYANVTPGE